MKLLRTSVMCLVYTLTIIELGDARPQAPDFQTTTTNAVTAAAQARDRAVSAAKAANNIIAESGSQAATNDYIIGSALANVARAAAAAADVAAKAASGDRNSMAQLSNAFRQITIQAQSAGSTIDTLLKSTLGPATDSISGLLSGGKLPGSDSISGLLSGGKLPGTDSISGLLSGGKLPGSDSISGLLSGGKLPGSDSISGLLSGGKLPILGSIGADTLSIGPLIEAVRAVVGTAGRATTAANAASAAVRSKTKTEAETNAARAQKAASDAQNLAQEAASTATTTDMIPGTEITNSIIVLVARAMAEATEAVAEVANSVVEKFRNGATSAGGIVNDRSSVFGGLLNPIFR